MKKKPALTVVFLGSMLLFGIQPMLGGTLLPAFGGSAAVWTVCLASFQSLLLVGYLYAHLVSEKSARVQRMMHILLLGVAVVWSMGFVFLLPQLRALIGHGGSIALKVLFSVMFIAGLPYVLLSAGSTLVQVWVSRTTVDSKGGVYKLYAVSNFGSFVGLFAYPVLVEPWLSLRAQWSGFVVLLGVYTVLMAFNAPKVDAEKAVLADGEGEVSARPKGRWLWFVLPACSVFLLNALTAHVTLDIMPLPLLWAVLLALFLLSYVVGFSGVHSGWFVPVPFIAGACAIVSVVMSHRFDDIGFVGYFVATLGLCFFGPLFLHHWLFQLRPGTDHLTRFYLGNAVGGAVGGFAASLLAPVLFKTVAEYPISLVFMSGCMMVYSIFRFKVQRIVASGVFVVAVLSLVVTGFVFIWVPKNAARPVIWRDRGFYGTLSVTELPAKTATESGFIREFFHGNTLHGMQATLPSKRGLATSYYTSDAGGLAVNQHPKFKQGESMRVALVGLGLGVMSSYGRTNDYYRAYEISAEVLEVATNPSFFTFITGSSAKIDVVMGDARKALEVERDGGEPLYDVICLDTFTGDNIPRHHSTREAFQLYFDRLAPDGVLAVNISNRFMDLKPLIRSVGMTFDCPVLVLRQSDDYTQLRTASDWAFFIKSPPEDFIIPQGALIADVRRVRDFKLPTDDKGSFLNLINWPWRD